MVETQLLKVSEGQFILVKTQNGKLAIAEFRRRGKVTDVVWSLVNVEQQAPKIVPVEKLESIDPRSSVKTNDVKDGTPFEVVNEFIRRLRHGTKRDTDGVSSWDHVWELTTHKNGTWSVAARELFENHGVSAAVQIGDANHMVVLTGPVKGTYPDPVVCVFDLVRQDSQWRIDESEVLREKQAWALVDGYSRAPSVEFVVHPSNIVGDYPIIGSSLQHSFLSDGTYVERSFTQRPTVKKGAWQLKENTLIVETQKGVQQGKIVRLTQDGFTVTAEGDGTREIGYWRVAQE